MFQDIQLVQIWITFTTEGEILMINTKAAQFPLVTNSAFNKSHVYTSSSFTPRAFKALTCSSVSLN